MVNAGTKLRREKKVQKECIEVRVARWLCRESFELAKNTEVNPGGVVRAKTSERHER